MSRPEWVELGRIGAPFGLAGWVHVSSFTDPPEALLDYRSWRLRGRTGDTQTVTVAESRVHGERLVVRLTGIQERTGAARLANALIEVEREVLPVLPARQYYRADLIGLEVCNTEGCALGTVAYFVDAPGGAVMVVRDHREAASGTGAACEHWVLADRRHLLEVDLAAGRVRVDWPEKLD